jgi:hypothetical protein
MREDRLARIARWVLLGLAVAILLAGILALVLVVPGMLYPPLSTTELQAVSDPARRLELDNDRRKLQNDARTTFLQGLGGLAVLAGAYVAYRQLTNSREQLRVAQQGQITERFTHAIDQLGHAQLDIRLGGIYALERIARDSPDDRATIGEVLTAFVRSHAPWPPRLPGQYVATAPIDKVPELQVRAADVQASLTVLGRGGFALAAQGHGDRLDLHTVDLRRAKLPDAHLIGADFHGAHLERADLIDAHLEKARLADAHLERADLREAYLEGATANERTHWPTEQFDWRRAGVIFAFWDTAANGP